MDLTLKRRPAADDAITGEFFINGRLAFFSLERASRAIPAGRYRVAFTVSARASRHEIWSPDHQYRLPLVEDVPGRAGIRIHAANEAEELDGCIALGQRLSGPTLVRSRAAVEPFIDQVADVDGRNEDIWLTVRDPLPAGAQEALNA